MNIYYAPEEFGLEVVSMIEDPGSYEFNMFVVWKDKKGNLYYDEDSGCSCPSPFENVQGVEQLTRIDKNHFDVFEDAVNKFNKEYNKHASPTADERHQLIEKVKELLKLKNEN